MDEIQLLDIADELLVINKVTIEKLFQEENQNTLVLYLFYYKTAKWQKHNPIKANDDYCKKCLHWGIDKLQAAKKRLKEMNLIETIKRSNEKNIITGWYIKVNYFIEESTIPETTIPVSPQLEKQETNTINNNNKILNNNINTNKEKKFQKPTLEEIKEYCRERNNNVDAQTFYDYFETGGWVDSKGNKVKNWKQKIITWEKNTRKESRYEKEQRIMKEWLEKNE